MTILGIRAAIQTALATITGLRAYSEYPATLELPCAIVSLSPTLPVEYNLTAGNATCVYHFIIDLLLTRQGSIEEAQQALDLYVSFNGTSSIKTAVDAATLGTHADSIDVSGVDSFGPMTYNNELYIGARFTVDVWV